MCGLVVVIIIIVVVVCGLAVAVKGNSLGQVRPGVGGAAKGKIDLGAARRFTSSTSFFGLTTATDKPASHRNNEYFDPDHAIEGAKAHIPHIVAVAEARGDVTLESLSWMDSIKRKFMSD